MNTPDPRASDPMKVAQDLTDWAKDLERKAAQYTELQGRLGSVSVSAQSPDGVARVTVDSNGVPTELTITERGRGLDPSQLSRTLMQTLRQAQAKLREEVTQLTLATVGDDAAGRDIVQNYRERFTEPVQEEPPTPQPRTMNLGVPAEEPPAPPRAEPPRPQRRPRSDDDGDDYFGGPILRR
ncbi:YbaB/EbfC family nucleoid-associated protein [Saccharomonospora glauca]|uniref:YbaB/EbfC DNA-binding family protein n=1 Tax=Saccharomonospora glauca K62 TaxID=928724 RepID=I1CWR2_9PSEU|nr:YbaB/EbfC family nucleoid-associated protein [Saccharomonospora glauca]EIE97136.1 hypothetical protein SacglDRAFT_00173 [Saccharomonospora glauca K62]